MRTVKVEASGSYEILIGTLLDEAGERIARVISPCRAALITDDTVDLLYGERVRASLRGAGFEPITLSFPAGEASKTLATLGGLLERMGEAGLTKGDAAVCLGGGVVGDVGGLAAAMYARGIRFVQIPTTLLAAVDSSVGGKTAVNLGAAKNMAGAFAQPALVLCDTDILSNLPDALVRDGAAEVIKYGVLDDPRLLDLCASGGMMREIGRVVERCAQIKRGYVQQDEFDRGRRQLLNLGHTIGHAVEKCSNYTISHGRAVAIGLSAIARAARRLGVSGEDCSPAIERALGACGLPTQSPYTADELLRAAGMDKKRSGDEITLAVPVGLGRCELRMIPMTQLGDWIRAGVGHERAIVQPGAKLRGRLRAIASKSDAHRKLILAALSDVPTKLIMGTTSEDIEATIRGLCALGATVDRLPDGLLVTPLWGHVPASATLDCGESGSTLRFLMPVAAALGVVARFEARGRLGERPSAPLMAALGDNGIQFDAETPPFTMWGKLAGCVFRLPGDVSSQYVSGLLMVMPLLGAGSRLALTSALQSEGYVALTIEAMGRFGAGVLDLRGGGYWVREPRGYRSPGEIAVEGDWSSAAFWRAAELVCGTRIEIGGLGESAQPDTEIDDLVARFRGGGQDIDVSGCPDLAPILAVLGTQAAGTTRILNAARLRLKESDRLSAMRECLSALGADVRELPDALVIHGGGRLSGGTVDGKGDHRIVMAMAIAACAADGPVVIEGADAVRKSYPNFFEEYRQLGGIVNVESVWEQA